MDYVALLAMKTSFTGYLQTQPLVSSRIAKKRKTCVATSNNYTKHNNKAHARAILTPMR